MKTFGIIGGLGPESTLDFYREVVSAYRERITDGSTPHFIVNSVNMKHVVDAVTSNNLAALADYLSDEVKRLADAGASFALIAANTPHLVFDEVQRRSSIPLISIVEVAAEATNALGLRRVGLLGTRFTMKARLFPDAFSRFHIEIVTPGEAEQPVVHEIYMGELINGVVRDESRKRLLQIVDRMRTEDNIQGLLLGGTELSLIIKELPWTDVVLLDTMKIHVRRAIQELLS
jgi:aspartate racemase